jgi:hypothetical protein
MTPQPSVEGDDELPALEVTVGPDPFLDTTAGWVFR